MKPVIPVPICVQLSIHCIRVSQDHHPKPMLGERLRFPQLAGEILFKHSRERFFAFPLDRLMESRIIMEPDHKKLLLLYVSVNPLMFAIRPIRYKNEARSQHIRTTVQIGRVPRRFRHTM